MSLDNFAAVVGLISPFFYCHTVRKTSELWLASAYCRCVISMDIGVGAIGQTDQIGKEYVVAGFVFCSHIRKHVSLLHLH